MGSRGDCFDNAVPESFFATLKKKLVHRPSGHTGGFTSAASSSSRPWTEHHRRHSTRGYLSPAQFEAMTMTNNHENIG